MKHYKIKVPIYTGIFNIFLYDNKEELYKKFPDHKEFNGWCYKENNNNYVMIISKEVDASTLVHESIHIVNFIFGVHGVKLDVNNDEHQAYFTTWVFEQCENCIKK